MRKPEFPDFQPIIPLTGEIIRKMADFLDVSYSVLYQIYRKNHEPSAAIKRRIEKNTGLPIQIWNEPAHHRNLRIYNRFRQTRHDQPTRDNADRADHAEEEIAGIL